MIEIGKKGVAVAIAVRIFVRKDAKAEVEEHHASVYAWHADGCIVKVDHPENLLHSRPVSASFVKVF